VTASQSQAGLRTCDRVPGTHGAAHDAHTTWHDGIPGLDALNYVRKPVEAPSNVTMSKGTTLPTCSTQKRDRRSNRPRPAPCAKFGWLGLTPPFSGRRGVQACQALCPRQQEPACLFWPGLGAIVKCSSCSACGERFPMIMRCVINDSHIDLAMCRTFYPGLRTASKTKSLLSISPGWIWTLVYLAQHVSEPRLRHFTTTPRIPVQL
jgi:hypothetical protein